LGNIRQLSHEKKQLQVKLSSSAMAAAASGPSSAAVTMTSSTNIILDMKSEAAGSAAPTLGKRKESPSSITNILDVLSPGPFSTGSSAGTGLSEAANTTPASAMMTANRDVSGSGNSMMSQSYASDGIASLPRNTRRRTQQQQLLQSQQQQQAYAYETSSNPTAAVITTRSSKRLMMDALSSPSPSPSMMMRSSHRPSHNVILPSSSKASAVVSSQPLKKRKVNKHANQPLIYEFFGPHNPAVPKIIALRCLEFLSGKDFYSLSVTSSLWDSAAKDDALWET
jgi:hypothetical protein